MLAVEDKYQQFKDLNKMIIKPAIASPLKYCARYCTQRNSSRFSSFLMITDLSQRRSIASLSLASA
ncbi:hypothetical protein ACSLOE_30405, partial [Escherichia coli]